jgi:hypothetical protein
VSFDLEAGLQRRQDLWRDANQFVIISGHVWTCTYPTRGFERQKKFVSPWIIGCPPFTTYVQDDIAGNNTRCASSREKLTVKDTCIVCSNVGRVRNFRHDNPKVK